MLERATQRDLYDVQYSELLQTYLTYLTVQLYNQAGIGFVRNC